MRPFTFDVAGASVGRFTFLAALTAKFGFKSRAPTARKSWKLLKQRNFTHRSLTAMAVIRFEDVDSTTLQVKMTKGVQEK